MLTWTSSNGLTGGAQGQEPLVGAQWAQGRGQPRGRHERLYSLEVFPEDAFAAGRGWIMDAGADVGQFRNLCSTEGWGLGLWTVGLPADQVKQLRTDRDLGSSLEDNFEM